MNERLQALRAAQFRAKAVAAGKTLCRFCKSPTTAGRPYCLACYRRGRGFIQFHLDDLDLCDDYLRLNPRHRLRRIASGQYVNSTGDVSLRQTFRRLDGANIVSYVLRATDARTGEEREIGSYPSILEAHRAYLAHAKSLVLRNPYATKARIG